ncbi:MAG: PQQ-dependent sugar dehydrogenase, partial [Actinomycetota bacterium]|nr:PQQ-dependent sugar dehydrogenase [Actinomycetota bacterium]
SPSSVQITRVLVALVVVLILVVALLAFYVFDLRSEIDSLQVTVGKQAEGTGPAAPALEEDLQSGLEDLRTCFNKALENTFEDFYRYVFGGETPPGPDKIVETCGSLATTARVELYKGGLNFPVDMAWVPETDTIFFTEKATGNVRVLHGQRLVEPPCASLDVNADGERGTLGIAVDPGFQDNGFLYVYYTNADPLQNRITRFTVKNDRCTAPEHIVTDIPATDSTRHNGGQIEIVGDKMFVSVGDGYDDPSTAQDQKGTLGKILRYNLDGSIPEDNPFGSSAPAWAIGLRNPFGLAHNPGTGRLYASENGPNCDDELNLIDKGANYGWGPGYECGDKGVGPQPRVPLVRWTPPIVPTDLWYYTGKIESLAGDLYMGDFGSGRLHRFVLNDSGDEVTKDEIVYDSPSQIVDVSEGPEGLLYFLTPTGIFRVIGR